MPGPGGKRAARSRRAVVARLPDVSDRSDRLAFVVAKRTVPGRATVLAWRVLSSVMMYAPDGLEDPQPEQAEEAHQREVAGRTRPPPTAAGTRPRA